MPFCEDCAKYFAPSAMNPDGTCPSCGRELNAPDQPMTAKGLRELALQDAKAPWHFKLLVVALGIYLTWRLLQLVGLF